MLKGTSPIEAMSKSEEINPVDLLSEGISQSVTQSVSQLVENSI